MIKFDINTSKKYGEILNGIIEQGRALKTIHNPQTWSLSALTYALRLYDSTILFRDLKNKWQRELPFYDAWNVNFSKSANTIWEVVVDISSFTSNEMFSEWKHLCDKDINNFIRIANEYLNGDVPISEVLGYLENKDSGLSSVIENLGNKLVTVLLEIYKLPTEVSKTVYVELYDSLMGKYMDEHKNNPYPIITDGEETTFDNWIASKTEKQRKKSVQNKLKSINSDMSKDVKDNLWKEIWDDNVFMGECKIDKEGIGRALFAKRKAIIEQSGIFLNDNLNLLFSSLSLCTHLWDYESSQNEGAFENLPKTRQEMICRLEALIEKGLWVEPATVESMKGFLRQVLGVGPKKLYNDEVKMSESLWNQFENGNNENVTFLKLIGYASFHKLTPEGKGAPKLKSVFFGNSSPSYQNISHGMPGNIGMTKDFKGILLLLDNYRPKNNNTTLEQIE